MAYVPSPPTVSATIELETARSHLQLAIQHLYEIREAIGALPIREVTDSGALTQLWERINRVDLASLADDEIPF